MKQKGSERMWLRQSVGQEKSREKGSVEKKREGSRVTTEEEGGREGGRALHTVSFDKPAT